MSARRIALAFVAGALLAGSAPNASAQAFPAKPIKLVVPFPAGGPADALARILADKLKPAWGETLIIENRAGAGGNIGAEYVARAAPDGYTLLLNASSHVINGSLYAKLPYDPVRDFTPISEVASYMLVLVTHPSVPANTLAELVAYLRSKPKGVPIANAGSGTPTHLTAALFGIAAGVDLLHVPYKGAAPANTDLLGGQVVAMFNNPVNALPQVKAGRLRALAVTGAKRLALVPDVPTVAESGYPGFEADQWYGVVAPAGTPAERVARLNAEINKALALPDVQQQLAIEGAVPAPGTPKAFGDLIAREIPRWAEVVKAGQVKPD